MEKIINLIYSELLKLKKSYLVISIILCGMLLPILSFIRYFFFLANVNIQVYFSLNEVLMFTSIMIIISIMLSSYIFLREYSDSTIVILYSYPISRVSILISKMTIIFILIALIYALNYILLFSGSLILYKGVQIEKLFFIKHLKAYLYSMILQFSLVPILVFITNLFKFFLGTVVLGVITSVINLFIMQTNWYVYLPTMLPSIPFIDFNDKSITNTTTGISLGIFVLGVILCLYQFSKLEEL